MDAPATRNKRVRFAHRAGEEEEDISSTAEAARPSVVRNAGPNLLAEEEVKDWRELRGELYDDAHLEQLAETEGEIEPFNLNQEAKLGKFDESGSFTWTRKDLEEDGDEQWLEQIRGQVATPRKKDLPTPQPRLSTEESLARLVSALEPKETPAEAIHRLRGDTMAIEALAEACDRLLGAGLLEVYSTAREALYAKTQLVQWFYRVEGEIEEYGPFSGLDMQDWRREGFFLEDSEQKCVVRDSNGGDQWVKAWDLSNFLFPLKRASVQ